MANNSTIKCSDLEEAVFELCSQNPQLENVQVYEHTDGNTYIALEAGTTSKLQAIAKKIAGVGSKSQPVSNPTRKSTLDNINQYMPGKKNAKAKLEYFKLEDINNSSSYIGKADKTIQIAISSNYESFASVLMNSYENLDGVEEEKPFETVITSLMSQLEQITTGVYVESFKKFEKVMNSKINTSIKQAIKQKQELLDKSEIEQISVESLTKNSINHKTSYDLIEGYEKEAALRAYSTLTVIIEKKMRVCLEILKRFLLFSYKNFEEIEGLVFSNEDKGEESANEAIMRLNEKLDEFYKRTVVPSSENNKLNFDFAPINIVVDDGYAPTKGSSLNDFVQQEITQEPNNLLLKDFSAWTITKDTTMFELISIIKSMSVYLRMQL